MIKLSENSDEIIVRYFPIAQWISGGFITLFLIIFSLWFVYNTLSDPTTVLYDSYKIFCLIVIVTGTFGSLKMIRAPLIMLAINQKAESVDISHHRFYGKKLERFYFHQIDKFKSYKKKEKSPSKYFLALILFSRKTIKLEIPINYNQRKTREFVRKLNKIIKSTKLIRLKS